MLDQLLQNINKLKYFIIINAIIYFFVLIICIYGSCTLNITESYSDNQPSYTELLLNNSSVFLLLLFGNLIFGIGGSLLLLINGLYHGISMGVYIGDNNLYSLLIKILPYGFLEICSLLTAASVGQYIFFLYWKGFNKEKSIGNKIRIKKLIIGSYSNLVFGLFLLILSSLIEYLVYNRG